MPPTKWVSTAHGDRVEHVLPVVVPWSTTLPRRPGSSRPADRARSGRGLAPASRCPRGVGAPPTWPSMIELLRHYEGQSRSDGQPRVLVDSDQHPLFCLRGRGKCCSRGKIRRRDGRKVAAARRNCGAVRAAGARRASAARGLPGGRPGIVPRHRLRGRGGRPSTPRGWPRRCARRRRRCARRR